MGKHVVVQNQLLTKQRNGVVKVNKRPATAVSTHTTRTASAVSTHTTRTRTRPVTRGRSTAPTREDPPMDRQDLIVLGRDRSQSPRPHPMPRSKVKTSVVSADSIWDMSIPDNWPVRKLRQELNKKGINVPVGMAKSMIVKLVKANCSNHLKGVQNQSNLDDITRCELEQDADEDVGDDSDTGMDMVPDTTPPPASPLPGSAHTFSPTQLGKLQETVVNMQTMMAKLDHSIQVLQQGQQVPVTMVTSSNMAAPMTSHGNTGISNLF